MDEMDGRRRRKSPSIGEKITRNKPKGQQMKGRRMKRKEDFKMPNFPPYGTMPASPEPMPPTPNMLMYDKLATKIQILRDEEKGKAFKIVMSFIMAIFMTGPIICLFIHQVCVSRCLFLRRMVKPFHPEIDDVLIILLFVFYLFINFTFICVIYSFFRQSIRAAYFKFVAILGYRPPLPSYIEGWLIMDKTNMKKPTKELLPYS